MLDHILFGSRNRSCLHNVRTRRGKITLTDHEMVIAQVRFKLVAQKPRSQPKVCSAKLRDEVTREAFCAEVKRYLDESDNVQGVEQSWANFRTALNAAATKLLIPEKRVHKPWVTVETLALIRKRAELQLRFTCDKCERKFKTVNGRKVHQSRYCGKPKAVATRVFSCKVQDVLGNEFENIEAFKYLGSYVSLKHGDLQEVNCKLAEGRQRFANFQNLWKSKQLSVHLKCNLYKALVLSAVLYSSETWTLSKLMERKLESFHCGCLRRILRVSYLEKATNEEIMSRSRMPQLSTMIMLKRIKWYGHIQRMEPGRLARSAFDWDPPVNTSMLDALMGGNGKRG